MNENVSVKRVSFDYLGAISMFALVGVGLALVYSAGTAKNDLVYFYKQITFAGIGLGILIALTIITPRLYYALAYVGYVLALVLLLFVLVSGIVGFGAKRWLYIGFMTLQPSEPAKIAFIFALSRLLSDWREEVSWKLVGKIFLLSLPVFGLVLAQPDLGTSTVFVVTAVAIMIWYGFPISYFLVLGLPAISTLIWLKPAVFITIVILGLIWLKREKMNWIILVLLALLCTGASFLGPFAWDQLEPYQKARLTTFLDPSADPLGSGYQVIQSQVAIGSGGMTGLGYLQGTQTQLRFLPQQHTDFIFSLAGEELGFIGTSFILFLYSLLAWRGFTTANRIHNQFMGLVAAGLTTMLAYHSIVNIGMALGNLPVTGLPLPFLSYGGSFLFTCLAAGGIILSSSLHKRTY